MLQWADTSKHLAAHLYFLRGVVERLSAAELPPLTRPFDMALELRAVREVVLFSLRNSDATSVGVMMAAARAEKIAGPRDWRNFVTRVLRAEVKLYAEALNLPGAPIWSPPRSEAAQEVEVFALRTVIMIVTRHSLSPGQMQLGLDEVRSLKAEYDAEGRSDDDSDLLVSVVAEQFYTDWLDATANARQVSAPARTVH